MEWLKKYWQFFVGGLVALFSILLFFRKKDDVPEIIEQTTKSGNDALENIIEKNLIREEKIEDLENQREEELKRIEKAYEENLKKMNSTLKRKIKTAIENGDEKRATRLLSTITGIKNLD